MAGTIANTKILIRKLRQGVFMAMMATPFSELFVQLA
jgi:hypothetical protein